MYKSWQPDWQAIPFGELFDPFFTTKESGEGTGLGFSVSYGIIQTHQGRIEVENEAGKGSIFRLRFPVGE